MNMRANNCPNFNHRRSDAPVRGCPMCGEVVNAKLRAMRCGEDEHAVRRRNGDMFCTACGERLRTP
jgi:hypothetical protein